MVTVTEKTQKPESIIRNLVDIYNVIEKSATTTGWMFYFTDNKGRLSKEEVEKLCQTAVIKAIIEYDPEKEVKFSLFKEFVVMRELTNAIILKENQMFEDHYEFNMFSAEGSPEKELYEEYKKNGASPLVKQHAMETLLEKLRQNQEGKHAES